MIETTDTFLTSLGEQLKNGREALNLSIEEVAQKTNLKKSHIESFENDIFILQNVPPAFVRGYVRNYVRFLRLPESLISQPNYGEVSLPKSVKKVAPLKVSNHKSQKRWVKLLTWLILLCAAGMTLTWWWQEHQKDEQMRTEIVSSSENSVALNISNVSSSEIPATTQPETSTPAVEMPIAPVVQQAVENQTNNTETAALETTATNTAALPAVNTAQTETAVVNTATENPEKSSPAEVAASDNVLRIEIIKAQSWITVKGSESKTNLAEKLYVAGDVLTFNDVDELYRVTIGAPAYVKVYYKGQEVPMKLDGRVARLKFPQ